MTPIPYFPRGPELEEGQRLIEAAKLWRFTYFFPKPLNTILTAFGRHQPAFSIRQNNDEAEALGR